MFAAIARPKDACPSSASVATLPAPVGTVRPHPSPRAHAAARAGPQRGARGRACSPPSRRRPRSAGTSLDARCDGVVAAQQAELHRRTARRACRRTPGSSRPGSSAARAGTPSAAARPTRAGRWYRVVSVNGKSVQKLYGQKAVYGAKSLFSVVYLPLEATCGGVRLRTDSRTTATAEGQAAGRRRVDRLGHRLGRQVDRRLRRPDLAAPAGTGSRGSATAACPRCTASRRCTRRAACGGRSRSRSRRRPRRPASSRASTSATGRARSAGRTSPPPASGSRS